VLVLFCFSVMLDDELTVVDADLERVDHHQRADGNV
jgi:hypothetical protein